MILYCSSFNIGFCLNYYGIFGYVTKIIAAFYVFQYFLAGVFIPLGGSSTGKKYLHDPPKYRQLTVLFHTDLVPQS